MTTTPLPNPKPRLKQTTERRRMWVPPRPVPFDEFLELFGKDDDVELIDGTVVQRAMVQLDHEKLLAWLLTLLNLYTSEHDLGMVLGSRTAVEITPFRGRLPDLLFVRRERVSIVGQKAVRGAPDLIVELVSPSDRPSDLLARETDYRAIGAGQIIFINQGRQTVRVLRKRGDSSDYDEETPPADGLLRLDAVNNLVIPVAWLLDEAQRPAPHETQRALLAVPQLG